SRIFPFSLVSPLAGLKAGLQGRSYNCRGGQQIAVDERIALNYFSGANGNGVAEDGTVENEGVELAILAAGVDSRGQIAEERNGEVAAGETSVDHFGINARGDSAELGSVETADEFASLALPDGEERGHADAREIFLAVGAEIFQEDVAESDLSHAIGVMDAQGFFHARLVNRIDALRWNAHLVQRKPDGLGLLHKEFAAHAVHADAFVGFGYRGQERDDTDVSALQ